MTPMPVVRSGANRLRATRWSRDYLPVLDELSEFGVRDMKALQQLVSPLAEVKAGLFIKPEVVLTRTPC